MAVFLRSSSLLVLAFAFCRTGASVQQPAPPEPDPDEKQLILRIQAEPAAGRRASLLVEFTTRFPGSPSAHWAYERLQAAYLDQGSYAQAIETGQRLMDIYPADIDGAVNCLKAAQALNIVELIRRYAVESWKRASWVAAKPEPEAGYARAVMSDAEFALSSLAHDPDPETRAGATRALVRLNPGSAFLRNGALQSTAGTATRLRGPAVAGDSDEPDEVGRLIAAADYDLQRGQHLTGVLDKSRRVLELVQGEGDPRRGRYREAARWMSGVAASFLGRYAFADEQLRAALPGIRDRPDALAIALYHLGYANYWLAEMGERSRILDALKFNVQCAAMPGPYRELAAQTVASIRSQYNLH